MSDDRLKLAFSAPASPARVVALAKRIEAIVTAAGADPSADDVTVIIENYDLRGVITSRNAVGRSALSTVAGVVRDPQLKTGVPTALRRQVAGAVAEMLVEFSHDDPQIVLPGARNSQRLPTKIVEYLRASAVPPTAPPMRYTGTTIESPVLRCGRVEENGRVCARLVIHGKPCEIPIPRPEDAEAFHDAAKKGTPHRVKVSLAYRDTSEGRQFYPGDSLALKILHEMVSASGAQFLAKAKAGMRFDPNEGAT
jgi:hypothetical protein